MFALTLLAGPPPAETISLLEKLWLMFAAAGVAKLSVGVLAVAGVVAFFWWMQAKA
jgi:hypothetical protein